MRRSLASALALGLASSACTFDDGQPWGEAQVRVRVGFEVPDDRALDDAVRTSRDYAVRLERLTVTLDALRISQGSAGETPTAFDPAAPPPGYSLCHNGHCHAADGRLVDYADIEAEVLGGSATGASTERALDARVEVPVGGDARGPEVRLDLPAGPLVSLGLVVGSIRLEGRVDDLRSQRRLVEDDQAFDYTLPVAAALVAPLDGEVGRDGPGRFTLQAHLALPVALLDRIDFADVGISTDTADGLLSGTLRIEPSH